MLRRAAFGLFLSLGGCTPPAGGGAPPPVVPAPPAAAPTPAPDPVTNTVRVAFFGDSLTAGFGLSPDQAYPALVGRALTEAGLPVTILNAGVSGDTTAAGLRRLDWTLQQHPDVFVLALGANDMLRGLPVTEARANLTTIAERARAAGATVVLAGMRANPSLGPDYATAFDAIYPDLSRTLNAPLLPFLLDGVIGDPAFTQSDGVHPTAAGQQRIAALLLPVLEPIVKERVAGR